MTDSKCRDCDHLQGWGEVSHSWSSLFGWSWMFQEKGLYPVASPPGCSQGSTCQRPWCTFGQDAGLLHSNPKKGKVPVTVTSERCNICSPDLTAAVPHRGIIWWSNPPDRRIPEIHLGTLRILAESQAPCTTSSPRTPLTLDSHCPLGSGWAIGRGQSRTAWPCNRCLTTRWMAERKYRKKTGRLLDCWWGYLHS